MSGGIAAGGLLEARSVAKEDTFYFNGPGISGAATLTYGPGTDAKYPEAFEVTGASGFFSIPTTA